MNRKILPESHVHPEALTFMTQNHMAIVQSVIQAVEKNKIVVVGMGQNPVVQKARRALDEAKLPYTYLSYGNYFSQWQQRLAIKLWSGWPTYPQIFIDGKLVGGCSDLIKYLQNKK